MNLKETQELIDNTHDLLVEDFRLTYHRKPVEKELLIHLKQLIKDGNHLEIVENAIGESIKCPNDYYKLLLLVASTK
jgi:hypothetical protein